MSYFFAAALIALFCVIPVFVYRVVRGPDMFDRLIGLNGIATKSILFLLLIGAYFGELEMLIDIVLGYGLLNLVGALAVAKYIEQKGIK